MLPRQLSLALPVTGRRSLPEQHHSDCRYKTLLRSTRMYGRAEVDKVYESQGRLKVPSVGNMGNYLVVISRLGVSLDMGLT